MSTHTQVSNTQELEKIEVAMRRAAEKARELSRQTNTPFIVLRDGKIVDLNAEERERATKGSAS